jgi:RNA polymerase sigma-70 factor (ECF subfamily)
VGELPSHEALIAVARTAGACWPGVNVAPERFAQHLVVRLPPHGDLARLHVSDLYLACACADGDAGALALFERQFLARVGDAVARVDSSRAFIDEVRQRLRERLLVGPTAKIADYSGSGSLEGWVMVAAIRLAHNLVRSDRVREAAARTLADEVPLDEDPELEIIRARYQGEVQSALRDALAMLSPDERHLMRLHYVEGVGLDRIGALHRVNKSTVSRWLAAARARILDEAKRTLAARLGLDEPSLRSLLRVVHQDLELSLGPLMTTG